MQFAKRMTDFIQGHEKIYCYGAGVYAAALVHFLAEQHRKPLGCIVSDGESAAASCEGVPITALSDTELGADVGIVLALAEKWHDVLAEALQQKGICASQIYRLTEPEVNAIRIWESVALNQSGKQPTSGEVEQYEECYRNLMAKFVRIEVRMIFIGAVGASLHELFYHKRYGFPREDVYYLFAFIGVGGGPWENAFEKPNSFLYKVFHGEQFCAVNRENLSFWKYVFAHHMDDVDINGAWSYYVDIIRDSIHKMHNGDFVGNRMTALDISCVEELGTQSLRRMGVRKEYVLFFVRDSVYYEKNRYDIKDTVLRIMDKYRNSDIESMKKTADYLIEKGISVVRIGATPLLDKNMGNIIDYAGEFHTDAMDFYLAKHCKFYVGDHSGAMYFTVYWDRPMVMINLPNITGYYDGTFPFDRRRDLGIYHKFWSKRENRLLNLSEILAIEDCSHEPPIYSGNINVMMKYHENDIVPIANTEDEILAVTQEMEERLQGTAIYSEEDQLLQEKFQAILRAYLKVRPEVLFYDVRIGRDFLRQNLWLTR